MHKKILSIAAALLCGTISFGQMMDNPTTESGRVLKNAAGSITLDWQNLLLTNGAWKATTDATTGAEVVSWRVLTNRIANSEAGSVAWGNLTGTLSAQTDLNSQLTNRYTKSQADAQFIENTEKASANGVATLDADVKIPFTQIPAIAITDVYVVNTTNDLANITNALVGDVTIVLDTPNAGTNANSYIATNTALPSSLADWVIIEKPLQYVSSVNGKIGTVVLNTDDINEGSGNLYYTISRTSSDGFITNNQQNVTLEGIFSQNGTNYLLDGGLLTGVTITNGIGYFGNLYVTTAASNGNQAVNWMVLTNQIALLAQDAVGLFAGSGTTGSVTSAGGDAGKYLKADGTWDIPSDTGLTTNDSPVMAAGTTWAFALATVTNAASSGNDIVNWTTLTNAIATSTNDPFSESIASSTLDFTDGLSIQRQSIYITNVAGTVYFETELIGGGDMTYLFGATRYTLDCTTGSGISGRARSGALTPGTDTVPVQNYAYVVPGVGTTAVLTNSTTFPTGEFAWCGKVLLKSAATTLANGALALQRTTEAISHNGRGADAYERERIRQLPADYSGGVDFTVTSGGGNVTWANTAGVVYQMHRQTFPAFTDPAEIIVINDPDTPYRTITNFNQITKDALGVAIPNNRSFGVRVYGYAASGDDGVSRLYCTLPNGVYNASANALSDTGNLDVNYLPAGLRGGGFSIARVVITVAASTYALASGGDQDIRGAVINATSGGGAAGGSQVDFQDTIFNIYASTDVTRRGFFSAAGISTATDRTYTMPNASGTMALINLAQTWSGLQTFALANVTNNADTGTEIVNYQTMTGYVVQATSPTNLPVAYWTGASDGVSANPANWLNGVVPTYGHLVVFERSRLTGAGGRPSSGAVTGAVIIIDGQGLPGWDGFGNGTTFNANEVRWGSTGADRFSGTVNGNFVIFDAQSGGASPSLINATIRGTVTYLDNFSPETGTTTFGARLIGSTGLMSLTGVATVDNEVVNYQTMTNNFGYLNDGSRLVSAWNGPTNFLYIVNPAGTVTNTVAETVNVP